MNFNPRSPYGERLSLRDAFTSSHPFQSTLPIRGATCGGVGGMRRGRFQSTLPIRGATNDINCIAHSVYISIHAPHTGSDQGHSVVEFTYTYFNPRSPYGERPQVDVLVHRKPDFNPRSPYGERPRHPPADVPPRNFNPRSPYGERLARLVARDVLDLISIHAPHTGSDATSARSPHRCAYFNPRSPYGERREERDVC